MYRFPITSAALLMLSATALAAQSGPPNKVEGIFTNAFASGFPRQIEDLSQSKLETNPAKGSVFAEYGNDDNTRNVQIRLFPLPEDGIDAVLLRDVQRYSDGSEIPVNTSETQSPQGEPMDCFTRRKGELGYTVCLAEIRGRAARLQMGAVVDPDADALPADIVERDQKLAGVFVDSIHEAPESAGAAEGDAPLFPADIPALDMSGADVRPQDTPFAKALPKELGDRSLKTISVSGPDTTYKAMYRDAEDTPTQIVIYTGEGGPLQDLAEFHEGELANILGSIQKTDTTTPDGLDMRCLHAVKVETLAANTCMAEVGLGLLEIQAVARIDEGVTDVPDDVINWAQESTGTLADAVAELN
ncbi:hypothetical protein [Paracoccus tegillarcae]|uniref:Uncharacterized protein n=1 Tax=Paracoccus tegillarcae TaxID=1529068 RepID=A0A2K9F0K4_9RHOB|nr:hypothetical protein [Paracoccus tegillarcae]AUH33892.1 hypothetical protein CUV01_11280 [Paracoccus tegillarcae]